MEQNTNIEISKYTLANFISSQQGDDSEIHQFNNWKNAIIKNDKYVYETVHMGPQTPSTSLKRSYNQVESKVVNTSSYNYLGYANDKRVIHSAKDALDIFGLGACGSPILNGTMNIHRILEKKLESFFNLEGRGISLFSSGYCVNLGVISAYLSKKDVCVLDRECHASIIDGARLSGAKIVFYRHNNMIDLERNLANIRSQSNGKILICTEGVFSTDGSIGNIKEMVEIAKKYKAKTLVDEAHSLLIAGETGRGICEAQGVLEEVDMIIVTFSKSFGAIGGCLYAKNEIINYVNYYARSRMFSCALGPAVTGGIIKVLEIAMSDEGKQRRNRIIFNSKYLKNRLEGFVEIVQTNTWIIPVIYGSDALTLPLGDELLRQGLDVSLMQFPAVQKNRGRIRLFVTSEHSILQLDIIAKIIIEASKKYNFSLPVSH